MLSLVWAESWLWLFGSVLLAVLWSNLTWLLLRHKSRSEALKEAVTRLTAWPLYPSMFQFLRLLYYLAVPFAALFWGQDVVVGRLLGLRRLALPRPDGTIDADVSANWLSWIGDVGWGIAIAVVCWVGLALGWWSYRRALAAVGQGSEVKGTGISAWVLLREAAYHEVHWAFYRNAPMGTLGDRYWGVWGGLAIVALEAALNPFWRQGLADPQRAPIQLVRAALSVVSGIFFLQAQNLWVVIGVHWLLTWGLVAFTRMFPSRVVARPESGAV